MVRAPAFGAVDSGLILSRVKPMILNLVLTVSTLKRTVWETSEQVYLWCR